MSPSNPLSLLRGPLILLSVTAALVAPYVADLSRETLGLLGLLILGVCVTVVDCLSCLNENAKALLHENLDAFVLDDWLRAIFDPEVGLIAVSTASFLGSSAMYSLAATDEQRVRLLQSGLWLRDREMARKILYQPGGIKLLFPPALLSWLTVKSSSSSPPLFHEDVEEDEIAKLFFEEDCMGKVQESSEDDESATGLYEEEKQTLRQEHQPQPFFSKKTAIHNKRVMMPHPKELQRPSTTDDQLDVPSQLLADPPMPHQVLGSIVMENVRGRMSTMWDQLPTLNRSTLGITGGTAALLLLIQLRSSRRARETVVNCIQSLTTMGLSSTVMASLSVLLSQSWNDSERRRLSYSAIREHTLRHLRQNWKRYLAALFLLYLRQRRQRSFRRS